MGQITSNAIVFGAFRLGGGLKKTSFVAIGYGVLVLGFVLVGLAVNPLNHTEVYGVTARLLLGAQTFLLGGYATAAVITMIQKDLTSRMMESNRLMPIDPRLAVLGYMFGAASPVTMMVLFNFVAGGMFAGAAGLPVEWWVASNIVLVTFSIFCWSLAACGAFFHTLLGFGLLAPIVIVNVSGGGAGMGLPPILMLCSPCLGSGMFAAHPLDGDQIMLLALSLILQAAVGSVFLHMAARRFKIADAPAMTARLGLLLVALLALSGAIAMNYGDTLTPMLRRRDETVMGIGSLVTLLFVATVVVMQHVADQQVFRPRASVVGGDAKVIVAICVCTGAFSIVTPGKVDLAERTIWTVAAMGIALTGVLLWSRLLMKEGAKMVNVIAVLLVLAFVPIMGGVIWTSSQMQWTREAQVTSQISPLMLVPLAWAPKQANDNMQMQAVSLVIEAILLAVPAALLWRRRGRGLNPMLKGAH